MLYLTHSVDEIRRALSSHVNLNETVDRIADIRQWAVDNRRKAVCFVTGVPGSGKTLIGLNLVHDPRFGTAGSGEAAFLSRQQPISRGSKGGIGARCYQIYRAGDRTRAP